MMSKTRNPSENDVTSDLLHDVCYHVELTAYCQNVTFCFDVNVEDSDCYVMSVLQ